MEDDCQYYCCGNCRGLLPSRMTLKTHKLSCSGISKKSDCPLFACERAEYLLCLQLKEYGIEDVSICENYKGNVLVSKVSDLCDSKNSLPNRNNDILQGSYMEKNRNSEEMDFLDHCENPRRSGRKRKETYANSDIWEETPNKRIKKCTEISSACPVIKNCDDYNHKEDLKFKKKMTQFSATAAVTSEKKNCYNIDQSNQHQFQLTPRKVKISPSCSRTDSTQNIGTRLKPCSISLVPLKLTHGCNGTAVKLPIISNIVDSSTKKKKKIQQATVSANNNSEHAESVSLGNGKSKQQCSENLVVCQTMENNDKRETNFKQVQNEESVKRKNVSQPKSLSTLHSPSILREQSKIVNLDNSRMPQNEMPERLTTCFGGVSSQEDNQELHVFEIKNVSEDSWEQSQTNINHVKTENNAETNNITETESWVNVSKSTLLNSQNKSPVSLSPEGKESFYLGVNFDQENCDDDSVNVSGYDSIDKSYQKNSGITDVRNMEINTLKDDRVMDVGDNEGFIPGNMDVNTSVIKEEQVTSDIDREHTYANRNEHPEKVSDPDVTTGMESFHQTTKLAMSNSWHCGSSASTACLSPGNVPNKSKLLTKIVVNTPVKGSGHERRLVWKNNTNNVLTQETSKVAGKPKSTKKSVKLQQKQAVIATDEELEKRERLASYAFELVQEGGCLSKIYSCSICNKFSSKYIGHFDRHMQRRHNKGQLWQCGKCSFHCETKERLKKHENQHSRPYMCEYCPYKCAELKDLQRHVWIHTGEFPLHCSRCDYKCRQHKVLKEHMRKHTGELLKCEAEGCNFTTCYQWTMSNHIATKHTEQKRFSCDRCIYTTSDRGSFTKHVKLHLGMKEYKCSLCAFHAVTKHDVVRHMRTHTKEKLYFCDRCEFSSSYSYGLKIHMMSHLGVKPWQCALCGYNSITRHKVLRHLHQRHPNASDSHVVNLGLKLQLQYSDYKQASVKAESAQQHHVVIVREDELDTCTAIKTGYDEAALVTNTDEQKVDKEENETEIGSTCLSEITDATVGDEKSYEGNERGEEMLSEENIDRGTEIIVTNEEIVEQPAIDHALVIEGQPIQNPEMLVIERNAVTDMLVFQEQLVHRSELVSGSEMVVLEQQSSSGKEMFVVEEPLAIGEDMVVVEQPITMDNKMVLVGGPLTETEETVVVETPEVAGQEETSLTQIILQAMHEQNLVTAEMS